MEAAYRYAILKHQPSLHMDAKENLAILGGGYGR